MSLPVPVRDVITQVKFNLQLEDSDGTVGFVTDNDMLLIAKNAVNNLSAVLSTSYKSRLFRKSSMLTAVAGSDLVSLPLRTQYLNALSWITGDKVVPLEECEPEDFVIGAKEWTASAPPKYILENNVIRLVPAPTTNQTLRLAYVEILAIASLDDVIPGRPGYADFIISDICAQIQTRKGQDPSEFIAKRDFALVNIHAESQERDRFAVDQVRDLRPKPARRWWV